MLRDFLRIDVGRFIRPLAPLAPLALIAAFGGMLSFLLLRLSDPSWSVLISTNILVAADKVMGSWNQMPPRYSWMLLGFVVVALLYFAVWEAHKLGHASVRPVFLALPCLLLILSPLVWPALEIQLGPKPQRLPQNDGAPDAGEVRTFADIEFVWIPPGRFRMGSAARETGRNADEVPHVVTLMKGFWLGKYEVTQAQWQAIMDGNPASFKDGGGDCPVESVTWDDCQRFIGKINRVKQGRFRLPREAEWEYACRAGDMGAYAFGNNVAALDGYAWYDATAKAQPHPAGQRQPNVWGLHDMHGNVWEWCQDWYGIYATTSRAINPAGPATGQDHVLRGGSWNSRAGDCRCARRFIFVEGYYRLKNDIGFRLARDADRPR